MGALDGLILVSVFARNHITSAARGTSEKLPRHRLKYRSDPPRRSFARLDRVRDATRPPWDKAQEVTAVVAFVASDEASYVTGEIIPASGGFR